MFSDNNAGIDDSLLGGVIASKYDAYSLVDQWTSYGWNVFTLDDGNDYDQVVAALKTMEDWDPKDRRPMIVIGKTVKGYWPYARARQRSPAITSRSSAIRAIPTRMKMNSDYFVALGKNVRGAIWRRVRGHPRGRGHRSARASDPVQGQYRRRDVGAGPQRPGRLAGRPAGRHRRHGEGRMQSCTSTSSTIRSWTIACASRICRWNRKRSRVKNRVSGCRKKSASRCSASRAKLPARAAAFRKSSSG